MVNPILKKFQPVTKIDMPLTIHPLRKLSFGLLLILIEGVSKMLRQTSIMSSSLPNKEKSSNRHMFENERLLILIETFYLMNTLPMQYFI